MMYVLRGFHHQQGDVYFSKRGAPVVDREEAQRFTRASNARDRASALNGQAAATGVWYAEVERIAE